MLPNPTTVTVTATSAVDSNPSAAAIAIVTLVPTTSSRFKGNYAFRFSGFDANGAVYSAGTFFSDGLGHISAGVEDVNRSTGVQSLALTGNYTVGTDNRGTMTLNDGSVTSTYDLAVGSSGKVIFIESDSTGTRGSGIIEKADPTQFSNGKIVGPYVMGLFGSDPSGKRVGAAGIFTTDGVSPNGTVTVGAIDINDAGSQVASASLSGTYSVASNGKGTLQVTVPSIPATFNFSFYVVTSGELFMVSTDPVSATNPRMGGLVLSQAVNIYSDSSFNGSGVFNLTGLDASLSNVVAVGILGTDGSGNVTSGSMFDENNAGTLLAQQPLAGTYSVSSNGAGTISFTSSNAPASSFALYAITSNKAFLVDTSSSNALSGIVEPQVTGSTGSFSAATIQGSFITGTTSTANSGATNLSGVLSLDGSSSITGTQDPSGQAFAATYTVSANGRGTMNVTSPSANSRVLYVVNGSKFIAIGVDNGDANSTVIESER